MSQPAKQTSSTKKTSGAKNDGAHGDPPKPPTKVVLTEREIDAPSINTLIMLGVVSITTLILWAAGRAACNYHVPGESLTPRKVSLEEKTRSPKDVGIEFAQALSGADFETAEKLAIGEGLNLIAEARAACGSCQPQVAARPTLLSRGIVKKANAQDSIVQVETFQDGKLTTTRFLGIERQERNYRVSRAYGSLEQAELKQPVHGQSPLSPSAPGTLEDDAALPSASGKPAEPAAPVLDLQLSTDSAAVDPVVQDD